MLRKCQPLPVWGFRSALDAVRKYSDSGELRIIDGSAAFVVNAFKTQFESSLTTSVVIASGIGHIKFGEVLGTRAVDRPPRCCRGGQTDRGDALRSRHVLSKAEASVF